VSRLHRGVPLLQGDRRAPELRGLSLLGVSQIDRVVEAVEETLRGHTVQLLAKKALPRLDLPKASQGWWRAAGPVSWGLSACTACSTAAVGLFVQHA
jgi:threonylcarbamoyladenosine tRNA methylthiotransferase CDKAL1